MLKPIVKTNVYTEAADQLVAAIESKQWPPGSRLPSERALAQMLGVGRTSVREALRVLQVMDLIDIRPGEGTFVREKALPLAEMKLRPLLQDKEVGDLYEIRELLEVQTAALAVERATPEDIEAMERILTRMAERIEASESCVNEDYEFHMTLVRAVDNQILVQILEMVWDRLRPIVERLFQVSGRAERTLAEHRAILEAIKNDDAALSRIRMLEHLHSRFTDPTLSTINRARENARRR
jgi:GntR family transcriptional regulator, transcriptional repressor for pyruvate dehydrogenase complex